MEAKPRKSYQSPRFLRKKTTETQVLQDSLKKVVLLCCTIRCFTKENTGGFNKVGSLYRLYMELYTYNPSKWPYRCVTGVISPPKSMELWAALKDLWDFCHNFLLWGIRSHPTELSSDQVGPLVICGMIRDEILPSPIPGLPLDRRDEDQGS